MAAFWPSLHASPYYPLSLTTEFASGGAAAISPHHMLYAVLVILFMCVALLFRRQAQRLVPYAMPLAALAGVLGSAGSAVLAFEFLPGGVREGVAVVGVALYVAAFFLTWLLLAARGDASQVPLAVLSSYALFALVWMLVQAFLPNVVSVFLVFCPLISALCLCAHLLLGASFGALADGSVRQLPWSLVVLCLVFVYFGVIAIRVFTAMETGQVLAGGVPLLPSLISTGTALLLGLASVGYLATKGYSSIARLVGLAVLTLVYVASLLVMMIAEPGSQVMLASKRVLVGAEHCFEVLLVLVAAYFVSKQDSAGMKAFVLVGIFTCVLPQLISFDLLFQTGVLAMLANLDFIVPIAAIAAFCIVVGVVVVLLRYSTRATELAQEAAQQASKQGEDWQKDLCARATEGFGITGRELDVVELTYRGYSAKRIAEELLVSESTVKAHLSHAYRKLDIHSKQELIAHIDSFR